jgi:hypothetical protein
MKTFGYVAMCTLVMAGMLSGCATPQRIGAKQLDEKEASDLAALGTSNFGIRWEGRLSGGGERGVVAVTDGVTTLTTRTGNRIFVIHNRKEFPPSEQMGFKGSDDELKRIGVTFLRASGAREDEVADMQVLQQFTQSGEVVPATKVVRLQEPQRSHRTLVISRRVAGVDVVSSRVVLYVDGSGRIAFMELAWPDLNREVVDRALRYKALIDGRYAPPPMEGADVEAVQPVILHSPAVGFYNDATAAIRVIYRPNSRQVGQKPVRYVDERGDDVTLPRDVDRVREEPLKRAEARK